MNKHHKPRRSGPNGRRDGANRPDSRPQRGSPHSTGAAARGDARGAGTAQPGSGATGPDGATADGATPEVPDAWRPEVRALVGPVQDLVRGRYTPARMRNQNIPLAEIHRDGLRDLKATFTSKRDERDVGYLSGPRARGAYLLYYSFTGAATTQAVLQRGEERDAWAHLPTDRPIRVLDLGAGPLTATLGLALAWPDRQLDVTAVDGAKAALQDGAALLSAIRPDVRVRLEVGNLRDGALRQRLGGDYDVVLLANVLNEFRESVRRDDKRRYEDDDRRGTYTPAERLLKDVVHKRLAPQGRVVIIEPAARAPSRLLISLRDQISADGVADIFAPCLGTPRCPLGAAHSRDWCHSEQPWKRPRPVAASDRVLGHRRDVLKYSYLILGKPGTASAPPANAWRMIGGPMGTPQAMQRRYVCGSAGRVVVLDNSGSVAFHEGLRGDLLVVPGEPRAGRRPGELELRLPRDGRRPHRPPSDEQDPRSHGSSRSSSRGPGSAAGSRNSDRGGGAQDRDGSGTGSGKPGKAKARPRLDRQDRPFYSKRKKQKPGGRKK